MRCASNLHHNKVVSIHLTATVVDKEKNGTRLYFTLFPSDVNLDLFHFCSVTQREILVLALKNAFSNSDLLTLVVSVPRYYLNPANQTLPSRQRVKHDDNTPFLT